MESRKSAQALDSGDVPPHLNPGMPLHNILFSSTFITCCQTRICHPGNPEKKKKKKKYPFRKKLDPCAFHGVHPGPPLSPSANSPFIPPLLGPATRDAKEDGRTAAWMRGGTVGSAASDAAEGAYVFSSSATPVRRGTDWAQSSSRWPALQKRDVDDDDDDVA